MRRRLGGAGERFCGDGFDCRWTRRSCVKIEYDKYEYTISAFQCICKWLKYALVGDYTKAIFN